MANTSDIRAFAATMAPAAEQLTGIATVLNAIADSIDTGGPVVTEVFQDYWTVKTAGGIGTQPMTEAQAVANAAAFTAAGVEAEAVHIIVAATV